ncbi:hypothetical protein NUU61_007684 [Penicillium alfredii]|uniref:Uncharacterized protein n=1 Tax=Penicillium alfredii TaxID=1506179 RepID=A0A9W9EQY9_9EURO|nr:uncharacterized protein NUU61_007684 [Penicillium alfredii]KAJ5086377.1 hypothetical protein NUU61_007684 [Penicillium alfredii]
MARTVLIIPDAGFVAGCLFFGVISSPYDLKAFGVAEILAVKPAREQQMVAILDGEQDGIMDNTYEHYTDAESGAL